MGPGPEKKISIEDFEFFKNVGEGSFGQVYLARNKVTDNFVAIKRLSKAGQWTEMADLIDDELLQEFAVVCERESDVATALHARFAGLVDSWQCTYECAEPERQGQMIQAIQQRGQ